MERSDNEDRLKTLQNLVKKAKSVIDKLSPGGKRDLTLVISCGYENNDVKRERETVVELKCETNIFPEGTQIPGIKIHQATYKLPRVDVPALLNAIQFLYSGELKDELCPKEEAELMMTYLNFPLPKLMEKESKTGKKCAQRKEEPASVLGLDDKKISLIPCVLKNSCRLFHPPPIQDCVPIKRPIISGRPRILSKNYGKGSPTIDLVHSYRALSNNVVAHFCVHEAGVTLIGYGMKTVIIQVSSVLFPNQLSYLCGRVQLTWPGAQVIIANTNGIIVDDLSLHNASRLTLTTGKVTVEAGLVKFEVSKGRISVCGRGLQLNGLDGVTFISKDFEADSNICARNLNVLTGEMKVKVPFSVEKLEEVFGELNPNFMISDVQPRFEEDRTDLRIKDGVHISVSNNLSLCMNNGGSGTNGGSISTKYWQLECPANFTNASGGSISISRNDQDDIGQELQRHAGIFNVAGNFTNHGNVNSPGKVTLNVKSFTPGETSVFGIRDAIFTTKEFVFKGKYDGHLKMDTETLDVPVNQVFEVQSGNVVSKEASIQGSFLCATKMQFESDQLINAENGFLAGRQMTMNVRKIANSGIIESLENFDLEAQDLQNDTEFATISGNQLRIKTGIVRNKGTLLGSNSLSLNCANGEVNNENGGKIMGDRQLSIKSITGVNQGSIISKEILNLDISTIENNGKVSAGQQIEFQNMKHLKNTGDFVSNGEIYFMTRDNDSVTIENFEGGSISSTNYMLVGEKVETFPKSSTVKFLNNGLVQSSSISLQSVNTLANRKSGRISFGSRLEIKKGLNATGRATAENEGVIESSQGQAYLGLDHFQNKGKGVISSNSYEIRADSVTNDMGAVLCANNEGTVNCTSISNDGRVASFGTLNLTSINTIENKKTGQFLSKNHNISTSNSGLKNAGHVNSKTGTISTQTLENSGTIRTEEQATLTTTTINNCSTGLISGGSLGIKASSNVTNKGLFLGNESCRISSPTISNMENGLLRGRTMLLEGNLVENPENGIISAENHLTAKVGKLVNHANGSIHAGGDFVMEGCSGAVKAGELANLSGKIEIEGDAVLNVTKIWNNNTHFNTRIDHVSTTPGIVEITPPGAEDHTIYRVTRTIHQTVINETLPGQLFVHGHLQLNCDEAVNDKSVVLCKSISGTLGNVQNLDAPLGQIITEDAGTSQYTWMETTRGGRRYKVCGPRKSSRSRRYSRRRPYHKRTITHRQLNAFQAITDAAPYFLGCSGEAISLLSRHLSNATSNLGLDTYFSQLTQYTSSIIMATSINLDIGQSIANSGTILAQELELRAGRVENNYGTILATNSAKIKASQNILNVGGQLGAGVLELDAGGDIQHITETHQDVSTTGGHTVVSTKSSKPVARVFGMRNVEQKAANDISMVGAETLCVEGKNKMVAGKDVTFDTITIENQRSHHWSSDAMLTENQSKEIGCKLGAGSGLDIIAGRNIHGRQVQAVAQQKDINLVAERGEIKITEGRKKFSRFTDTTARSSGMFHNTSVNRKTNFQVDGAKLSLMNAAQGKINFKAKNNLSLQGTRAVADLDVLAHSKEGKVKILSAESKQSLSVQRNEKYGELFSSEKQEAKLNQSLIANSASLLKSQKGNVGVKGKLKVTVKGSSLLAKQGKVDLTGAGVDVIPAINKQETHSSFKYQKSGFSVGYSNPVLDGVKTLQSLGENIERLDGNNSIMPLVGGGTVGLTAYNTLSAVQANPQTLGGIGGSVSWGHTEMEQERHEIQTECVPSIIEGHTEVTVTSTQDDINVIGSKVKAQDGPVLLKSARDINLKPGKNTRETVSSQSQSSTSIGIGVNLGTKGNGITASLSHSEAGMDGNYNATSFTNTLVESGNSSVTLSSNRDATLSGAVARGKRIVMDVGRNLHAESLQEVRNLEESSSSFGFGISCSANMIGASVNVGQSSTSSKYACVTQQTAIDAGENGYQINVGALTTLRGVGIHSKSTIEGQDKLETEELILESIQNATDYNANSISVGASFSTSLKKDKEITQNEDNAVSETKSNKIHATFAPMILQASGSSSSVTAPFIENAANSLKIRGPRQLSSQEKKQLENPANKFSPTLPEIYDAAAVQASMAIASTCIQQSGQFVGNKLAEARSKHEKAAAIIVEQHSNEDSVTKNEQLAKAETYRKEGIALEKQWGPGGTSRQIVNALTMAVGSNVSNTSIANFSSLAAINFAQQQGAKQIGKLVSKEVIQEGSLEHVALHGILASGAEALKGNGSPGSAALGAVVGAVFPSFAKSVLGLNDDTVRDLSSSVATLVVMGTGVNPQAAHNSAYLAIDNNFMTSSLILDIYEELNKIKDAFGWNALYITKGMVIGLYKAGVKDAQAMWNLLKNLDQVFHSLGELLSSPQLLAEVGAEAIAYLKKKYELVRAAFLSPELMSKSQAQELGEEMGELIWTLGWNTLAIYSLPKTAASLANGTTKLAQAGTFVARNPASVGQSLSRVGTLVKNPKAIIPLVNRSALSGMHPNLSTTEKWLIGEIYGHRALAQAIPKGVKASLVSVVQGRGHTGLDGVYKLVAANGRTGFLSVEFKYNTWTTRMTKKFGRQMGNRWVDGNLAKAFPKNGGALMAEFENAQKAGNTIKIITKTEKFGNVPFRVVDEAGRAIKNSEAAALEWIKTFGQ